MEELTTDITVRSYEADSFGHVNNAVFLNYLEYARGEYLKQRRLSFQDFEKWGAKPFLSKAFVDYKKPAFIEDNLVIKARISEVRRSSFRMDYEIRRKKDNALIATAWTVMVFVGDNGKPVKIPDEFIARFIGKDNAIKGAID